jgi:hypothetical protein
LPLKLIFLTSHAKLALGKDEDPMAKTRLSRNIVKQI